MLDLSLERLGGFGIGDQGEAGHVPPPPEIAGVPYDQGL